MLVYGAKSTEAKTNGGMLGSIYKIKTWVKNLDTFKLRKKIKRIN